MQSLQYFMESLACNKNLLTSRALYFFTTAKNKDFQEGKSKYSDTPAIYQVRLIAHTFHNLEHFKKDLVDSAIKTAKTHQNVTTMEGEIHGRFSTKRQDIPLMMNTVIESITRNFQLLKQESALLVDNLSQCFTNIHKIQSSCNQIALCFKNYREVVSEEFIETKRASKSIDLLLDTFKGWKEEMMDTIQKTQSFTELFRYTLAESECFDEYMLIRKIQGKEYLESQEKLDQKKEHLFQEGYSERWQIDSEIKQNITPENLEGSSNIAKLVMLPEVSPHSIIFFANFFIRRPPK